MNVKAILLGVAFWLCACLSIQAETKTITLRYSEHDVRYAKQADYDIVSLPESDFIQDTPGAPMMPFKTIFVLIPPGTEIKNVRVISKRETMLSGEFTIFPVQDPFPVDGYGERKFQEPKQEIYSSDRPYPGTLGQFSHEGYVRDYHIAEIRVYPLQYRPNRKELSFLTDMAFEVEYAESNKFQLDHRQRKNNKEEGNFREQIKSLVVNPAEVSLGGFESAESADMNLDAPAMTQPLSLSLSPSATEGLNVDYVIITSDALAPSFQRLAEWKTNKGLVAAVKTVSWICGSYPGCDPQEKIRRFIQDAYLKWGTVYVLLGGDTEIVPVRLNSYQEFSPITDLYYSAIFPVNDTWNANGDNLFGDGVLDYYADVFVGRAPVRDENEASVFIDKVLTYERSSLAPSLPSPDYLNKMLSLGGLVYPTYGWGYWCGIYSKERVNDNLVPPSLRTWKMYEYDPDFYARWGGYFTSDEELNTANAIKRINEGFSIINHYDHANPLVLGMGSCHREHLTENDADNLTNGNRYSVMLSQGCQPNAFDYDCIGEHLLLSKKGGLVAFIGSTRTNYCSSGTEHDYSFFTALYKNNIWHIGQTLAQSVRGYVFSAYSKNLLGDPEMPIWTGVPASLGIFHPSSVKIGDNDFTVTISNLPAGEKALVCLKKGEEDYAAQAVTGTGGAVNANFIFTPNTPGDLQITVTAHNFTPYEATVPVKIGASHVYVESYEIDDSEGVDYNSRGDGDGIIETGESIRFPVTLANSGDMGVVVGTVTLAAYERGTNTPHPYITIDDGTATYGTIDPGGRATEVRGYLFTVSTDCPDEEVVEFRLTMGASGVLADKMYLKVHAPKIQPTAHAIEWSKLQPAATVFLGVELSNVGTGSGREVSAVLSSSSPYIASIGGNTQMYGDIEPLASKKSGGNFYFTVSSGYPGDPKLLSFTLTIKDVYGKVWTSGFDLKRPNPPTGLKFNGYETSIDLIWTKPTANESPDDLAGYNVYRSDSSAGPYQKINNRLVERTSYYKDMGLTIETVYYYCVSAVDQSSNESEWTPPLEAWTTVKYEANWPKRLNGQMFPSPALFDVDGDGDMEIFTADKSGRVYAFDHTGIELFDIDSNPTSVSGFAYESGADFWSSPSIADLDGDGTDELVIAGRGNKYLYCWHINDGDGDGKPDPYWNVELSAPCLSSPALGDIDNDGHPEIVIMSHDGWVHVRRYDGSVYMTDPWKSIGGSIEAYCTPALVDLDFDGKCEIVIGGSDGYIHVWRFDGSYLSANWPFNTGRNNLSSSPAVADLDKDGQYEIVCVAGNHVSNGQATKCIVYVKDKNGNDKPGWIGGQAIPDAGSVVLPSPAIGNLDADSQLEIVVGTATQVFAWNCDGTSPAGWPQSGIQGTGSSPVIADIDGLPGEEIVIGSNDKKLYAWHADGSKLKGWPLVTGDAVGNSAAVGDVDGDGKDEVVAGSWDMNLYIWNTNGSGKRDWPMFHHDVQHTGRYETFVSGTISSNATWSGIVHVSGKVTVNAGVTLTIMPRTTVLFARGASLDVKGKLLANGTPLSRIVFTSETGTSISSWGKINLLGSGASGSSVTYADMSYGGELDVVNASNVMIGNCHFIETWEGVDFSGSTGWILNNRIESSSISHGIIVSYGSSVTCQQNVVKKPNRRAYGILFIHSATGYVWQNDIYGCDRGLGVVDNSTPKFCRDQTLPSEPGTPPESRSNRITNCNYGIFVMESSIPVIGADPPAGTGYNSLHDNTCEAYFTSGGTLLAMYNYWGGQPNPSMFVLGADCSINTDHWLPEDPWVEVPLP